MYKRLLNSLKRFFDWIGALPSKMGKFGSKIKDVFGNISSGIGNVVSDITVGVGNITGVGTNNVGVLLSNTEGQFGNAYNLKQKPT